MLKMISQCSEAGLTQLTHFHALAERIDLDGPALDILYDRIIEFRLGLVFILFGRVEKY